MQVSWPRKCACVAQYFALRFMLLCQCLCLECVCWIHCVVANFCAGVLAQKVCLRCPVFCIVLYGVVSVFMFGVHVLDPLCSCKLLCRCPGPASTQRSRPRRRATLTRAQSSFPSVRYTCSVVCVLVVMLQQVSGTHVLLCVC